MPRKPSEVPTPPDSVLVLPTHSFREAPSPGTLASAPLRTSAAKCRAANGASGPAAILRPPEHPAATASGLSLLTGSAFLARQVAECNALKRAARGHAPAQPRRRPPEGHRRAVLHRQQHQRGHLDQVLPRRPGRPRAPRQTLKRTQTLKPSSSTPNPQTLKRYVHSPAAGDSAAEASTTADEAENPIRATHDSCGAPL